MKEAERQRLIRAYKSFASQTRAFHHFEDGDKISRMITNEEYEVLEPFLSAEYQRTYKVGGIEMTVDGNISNYFANVILNERRQLFFENERHEAEFFASLCEMIEIVLSPTFDRIKNDVLYVCESEV